MLYKCRLEFLCAVFAIWWGIWVANPWWDAFATSTSFAWMARIAPEYVWGLLMLGAGALQLLICFTQQPELHIGVSILNLAVWLLVDVALAKGNWHSTAVVIYTFFVMLQTLLYVDWLTEQKYRHEAHHDDL